MTETITSLQNPKIKQLLVLQQKSSERRKTGLFVVEGQQEMAHCLHAGYEVDTVFYCPSLLPDFQVPQHARCFEVSREVYEKVAYRGSTEGVIAEVAILRSADASGVDAVVVCDPLTDLYNPNLIRSSVGAAFSVPCVACSSETCISFLKQRNIKILTAQLQDSHLYYDTDMTCGTAIVMGTEHDGLTDLWRRAADAHIRIPMLGQIDSLNVSVSAAILMFEAVRQRQNKKTDNR